MFVCLFYTKKESALFFPRLLFCRFEVIDGPDDFYNICGWCYVCNNFAHGLVVGGLWPFLELRHVALVVVEDDGVLASAFQPFRLLFLFGSLKRL